MLSVFLKQPTCWMVLFSLVCACIQEAQGSEKPSGVEKVEIEKETIRITVRAHSSPVHLFEQQPNDPPSIISGTPAATINRSGKRTVSISRFDGTRDRLYSSFVLARNGQPIGGRRFVEEWKNVSKFTEAYPQLKSKKGLQVQMVDDAIALGVKHAALNWNLGQMVSLKPDINDLPWIMDGETYHFRRDFMEGMDERIKTLSDAGMAVTLILLYYENPDENINSVMLHPKYDRACPQDLSAFNTVTREGLAWFKACIEFMADRYSNPKHPHGRVVNYIVGNEVNSHWQWANMGRVSMEEFTDDYLRTVRICHSAVRKHSSTARVFISLEHHWNTRSPGSATESFAGRAFLDYFNKRSKETGNFDWHMAYHPYPENLFECRTWNDKSAHPNADTPRITFKNLEVLPQYLRRPELLYRGKPRRIILSEQGFHSHDNAEGELWQAAAYCYAYYKTARLDDIDAFILHRHVDHQYEGGLRLGLWRRNEKGASAADPASKKPIYDVFRLADTPEWEKTFEFALPVIGIKSWEEITPRQTNK